jgi:hypothetical protein
MLRVSDNGRFLVYEDGRPFFYLGDTAWELFHRLDRVEAEFYLRNRAEKRFTVIQAVALAEFGGLTVPNRYGQLPLNNNDPAAPNPAYFEHVDAIVNLAASLNLFIGMLPTWGDKWNRLWGEGPEIFTPDNAYAYGLFLGRRYAEQPIIWILGGDRPVDTDAQRAIIEAMAAGLREGDGGRHLQTFHPSGGHSSTEYFGPNSPTASSPRTSDPKTSNRKIGDLLDFHICQSGHSRNCENWRIISADYALEPIRPCMDAEPGYEDHPAGFDIANGYLDDYDVRKSAYWGLFAGGHGHTYGCHDMWQFWQPDRKPITAARRDWHEAIHLPGSGQMRHVRALLESRPFLTRIPDQALIASEEGAGVQHVRATRDIEGTYALIYLPSGRPVEVDLDRLNGAEFAVHWYDPRTGVAQRNGTIPGHGRREFAPPPGGLDWVLTLDRADCAYRAPGAG